MALEKYFKDKIVVVTGASSGIGLATSRLLVQCGAKVVLAARSTGKLTSLAAELGPSNALPVTCDVTVEGDCRRLIELTVERYGRIDVLINNAGLSMRAAFKDVDLQVLHRLMNVNFWGCVYCTKYALPYLLESKGTVVGITSVAGYVGLPCRTGYSSSKFAMNGFLETLRSEHLYDGLHVMEFAPNFTASNVRLAALTADGTPQGITPRREEKMMTAERCAYLLARAIQRGRRKVVLTTLGFCTVRYFRTLFPRTMQKVEYNMMLKEPNSPLKDPKKK